MNIAHTMGRFRNKICHTILVIKKGEQYDKRHKK